MTGLQLYSYPPGSANAVGIWDTDNSNNYYVLGASMTLDGPLLNDPQSGEVNFPVAEGGSFVLFASDLQDMEFTSGFALTLFAFFSNAPAASTQVVIP